MMEVKPVTLTGKVIQRQTVEGSACARLDCGRNER